MNKSDVARQYRAKNPDMPTHKLARIMYAENKQMYINIEDARERLRYIEGKKGARLKKHVGNTDFLLEKARPSNPYKLPPSDEAAYEPYILKASKVAILSDIHAPYHNIEALTCALDYCKKAKVDAVLIDGDLFDFHGLSKFLKDPRKKNFAQELEIGAEILRIIQKELKCPVYFKLGNHDERYQHYLWQKLGELNGVEDFEFSNLLTKRVPGVKIIDDKRIVKLGQLNAVHGHEFGGSVFSPVNIARGFYLRAKASTIGGHHHRTSEHTEQDINGKIVTTWSVGSLCELHPAYLPINSWNHGFAIVDVEKNGDFTVHNKRIFKGKVL
jgi:predicted phosphodiesterase